MTRSRLFKYGPLCFYLCIPQFDSNESEELLDAAAKYMEQVEKSYPSRVFATAVIDINGKSVFITKYFKPLEPPEAVLELSTDKKIQMVCVLPKNVGGYLHTM